MATSEFRDRSFVQTGGHHIDFLLKGSSAYVSTFGIWHETRQIGETTELLSYGRVVAYAKLQNGHLDVMVEADILMTLARLTQNQAMCEAIKVLIAKAGTDSSVDEVRELCGRFGFDCRSEDGRRVNAAVGTLVHFKRIERGEIG